MAYITVADLRLYLRANAQTPLPSGDDDLLAVAITDAMAFIADHTGRVFEATADTTRLFTLDDVLGAKLTFDTDLATTPTEVLNGDGGSIPANAYRLEPLNHRPAYALLLKASHGYAWAGEEIQVTGRWAYSVEAPAGIQRICKRLAVYFYRQRGTNTDLDRPIMTADGTILTPARIPMDAADELRIFRRRTL